MSPDSRAPSPKQTPARRNSLAVVAALAVASLPVGAAHAKEYAASDPTGDVAKFTHTDDDQEVVEQSPGTANGAITRVRYTHDDRAVIVFAKYRALARSGNVRLDFARIVTSAGWKRDVTIIAGAGWWGGDATLSRPDGTAEDCTLTHKLDYDDESVTVGIPRGCLGNPGWVRAGLGSIWMNEDITYVDEALTSTVNDLPKPTPRIARG